MLLMSSSFTSWKRLRAGKGRCPEYGLGAMRERLTDNFNEDDKVSEGLFSFADAMNMSVTFCSMHLTLMHPCLSKNPLLHLGLQSLASRAHTVTPLRRITARPSSSQYYSKNVET